jgi:hypothetical protein
MASPVQTTTLRVEDFPSDQRTWLPRLLTPLNLFLTSTYNILNAGVNFGSNIPCQDQSLSFTYGGSSQVFAWNQTGIPAIVWVGQCKESATTIALTCAWSYDASNKRITIDFYKKDGSALTSGTSYTVFLRVVA